MGVFSEKHVNDAIGRISTQSSAQVKVLLARAVENQLESLRRACEKELETRPFEFTVTNAADFARMSTEVQNMDLLSATRHAFTKVKPPTAEEVQIVRWIADHPGTSFQETSAEYGKGDLALVIGHLVYFRCGCFRPFIREHEDQSSVLIAKDRSGPGIRYQLRPEAEMVFREIGVIPPTRQV